MATLSAELLISAYCQGVFPMADNGEIHWFEPMMRGVLPLDKRFHVPKSLRKMIRQGKFEVRLDSAFEGVIRACADREETWIDETIVESYLGLHRMGLAHSFECWDRDGLQGGLYGVQIGRAFFGESMFSRKSGGSKVALVALVDYLRSCGGELLDTQWLTEHLKKFGGYELTRDQYRIELARALRDIHPIDD